MMKIVADSMYKDKLIGLQELPANCRDAIIRRREAGDIFTPEILIKYNSTTHEISIKDNGCGMTREVVEKVYRFFGRSDKRNILGETGQFGIGAKCPFALTDEYSVSTVSMSTHKKLEFVVTKTKLGIIITQDEAPTTDEPGTTVTFIVPKKHSAYDIRNRLEKAVSHWLCPVYFIEDDHFSYKQQLSYKSDKPLLSVIGEGYYSALEMPQNIKYISSEYSFVTRNSDSKVFIGHIPYEFDFNFPVRLEIILHNQSLLTPTATREGLEKDGKYNEFVKQLKLQIMNILTPQFEKYFKNLPANVSDIRNMPEILVKIFTDLSDSNLVNPSDYPYHAILKEYHKYYSLSGYFKDSRLYEILSNSSVYYTTKKLSKDKRIYTTLYLPNLCTKPCILCDKFNGVCEDGKSSEELLTAFILPLPALPKTPRIKSSGLAGTIMRSDAHLRISNEDKHKYIFTKEKFDTEIDNIVLVSSKKFTQLKAEGFKVIDNIVEYQNTLLSKLFFTDIEGKSVTVPELKSYKTIIYNIKTEPQKLLLKLLYTSKKTLFLKDASIPKSVLSTLSEKQEAKTASSVMYSLNNNMQNTKITIEIPIAYIENVLTSLPSFNTKVTDMKIIKPSSPEKP